MALEEENSPSPFVTEEQWLVDCVVRDVLDFAAYRAPGADAPAKVWQAPELTTVATGDEFKLAWRMSPGAPEQTATLQAPVCVWLPEMYVAWAAKLFPVRTRRKSRTRRVTFWKRC